MLISMGLRNLHSSAVSDLCAWTIVSLCTANCYIVKQEGDESSPGSLQSVHLECCHFPFKPRCWLREISSHFTAVFFSDYLKHLRILLILRSFCKYFQVSDFFFFFNILQLILAELPMKWRLNNDRLFGDICLPTRHFLLAIQSLVSFL